MNDMIGGGEVVTVAEHKTLDFIAQRQTLERSHYALAVSLLESQDPDDRETARDLLAQIQVRILNEKLNLQRQIQRQYQEERIW